ncbi:hypothetical protein Zmor_024311 [Zophobas morio]|uniref:Uncharacterized protein n=1 Tax=Zophobas morio TaxID=2755281 RepID=A0AA38I1U7_9CUCU|nr:hypothetical protein Zmor_024311 [Zophobas morio]
MKNCRVNLTTTEDEKFVQFLWTDEPHFHEKNLENTVNWKGKKLTDLETCFDLASSLALQTTEGVRFAQLLDEKMTKVPVNWTTGVKKDLESLIILNVGFPTKDAKMKECRVNLTTIKDEKFVQFLWTDEPHFPEKNLENTVNRKGEKLTGLETCCDLVNSLALPTTEGVKFDQFRDEKMTKVLVNWTTGVKKDLEPLTILIVGFPTKDEKMKECLVNLTTIEDEKFVQFLRTDEPHFHEKNLENTVNWKGKKLTDLETCFDLASSLALPTTEGVKFDQFRDEKMTKVLVNWTTGVKKDLEPLTILIVGFPTKDEKMKECLVNLTTIEDEKFVQFLWTDDPYFHEKNLENTVNWKDEKLTGLETCSDLANSLPLPTTEGVKFDQLLDEKMTKVSVN